MKGYAAGQKAKDALWVKHALERTKVYLAMLQHPELPLPTIEFVDRKEEWLGMCTCSLRGLDVDAFLRGENMYSRIRLQRAILGDEYTFERTLAHEVCHHVEFFTFNRQELLAMAYGAKKVAHGRRFQELGERINKALNDPNFVTEKSDSADKLADMEKPYWLFIQSTDAHKYPYVKKAPEFGWKWAIKLDDHKKTWLRGAIEAGLGILVDSRDRYWTYGKAKIGHPGIAIPHAPEKQAALAELVQLTNPAWSLALLRPKLGELPADPDPKRWTRVC